MGGYVDDNATHYKEMNIWVDKVTGIITVFNSTEPGKYQYQELMGYVKGTSSILPDWEYPIPSNFNIGDILVVFSPDMDGGEEDATNDGPETMFIEHEIKFMYRNPETLEDVVVTERRGYEDPDLVTPLWTEMYIEEGRCIEDDPSSVFGSMFFDQDIIASMDLNEFGDMIAPMMDMVPGYSTVRDGNSLKTSGFDTFGRHAEFYIEGLDGFGFPEVQWRKYWNESDTEWHLELTIDGPGVIEGDPGIGVNEGDSWEVVAQTRFNYHHWYPSSPEEWHHEEGLMFMEYQVTHIFALNATVMAVIGSRREWESTHPEEERFKPFEPLLIYDTNQPASFLTYGGFANEMEGPPVLLPVVTDWSTHGSALEAQLESDLAFGASALRSHYTATSIRLAWDEEEDGPPVWNRARGQVYLESSAMGIVTHLDFNQEKEWSDDLGEGEEKREEIKMFSYSITPATGCVQNPATDITNLVSQDILIWEGQRYRPDETEIYKHDMSKVVIHELISACDGSIVFLGERFHREFSETMYYGDYWQLDPESPTPIDINFWMLSSVRDDDLWSWMQGQIFDNGVTDFAPYEDTIIAMLNFAFELPAGVSLTASDIATGPNWFEVTLYDADKDVNHVMKFAINAEGIMQDMLMGDQDPETGDWLNYERSVLVNGIGATGEYFSETLPMYTDADTSIDTTPDDSIFDIPGYPMLFISIIAFASIVFVIRKSKK